MRGPRHTWHSWLAADRRKCESRVDISWDGEPSATGASDPRNRFKSGIVGAEMSCSRIRGVRGILSAWTPSPGSTQHQKAATASSQSLPKEGWRPR